MNPSLAEKLANLPQIPGVYQFKDTTGEIIYVGKAKNLRSRVGSYFHLSVAPESKTAALVARINDIDYIQVESEFDAIILEAELIKKYQPKYNIIQKDDRSYLYIVFRKEKLVLRGNSPKLVLQKIITARKTELLPKDEKYGPYTDSYTAKYILRTLRKIFPFRDCSVNKFSTYNHWGRPCLYGELKLCPAPCVEPFVEHDKEMSRSISSVRRLLKGGSISLLNNLKREMNKHSRVHDYELAAEYRDLITKYDYIRRRYKLPESYIENPSLLDDLAEEALKDLVGILPFVGELPRMIECYDIANISGKEAVGSLVAAKDGKIDKRFYRKFRIKLKDTPDDFEMLREVLRRRFKKTGWGIPDLVVVDGGKGQISAVLEVISQIPEKVSVIGLAKKEETIVYKDIEGFHELKYPKDTPAVKLLIRLRDEAHRFAQAYHHKLRLKKLHE
jgi:excinuclease ABC subunit C